LDSHELLVPVLENWLALGIADKMTFEIVERPFAFLPNLTEWTEADEEELIDMINLNSMMDFAPPTIPAPMDESFGEVSTVNSNSAADLHLSFILELLYDPSLSSSPITSTSTAISNSDQKKELSSNDDIFNSSAMATPTREKIHQSNMNLFAGLYPHHLKSGFIHVYIPEKEEIK
jgi:hypothetical protein